MISASKNGHVKQFTEAAWELMGPTKNGWEPVQDQISENEVIVMPSTGQAPAVSNQIVENQVTKQEVQIVSNEVTESEPQIIDSDESKTEVSTETTDEFFSVAKSNLKRNTIKDFLDINEIKYKQNDPIDSLIELLREKFENDIEKLKAEFAI